MFYIDLENMAVCSWMRNNKSVNQVWNMKEIIQRRSGYWLLIVLVFFNFSCSGLHVGLETQEFQDLPLKHPVKNAEADRSNPPGRETGHQELQARSRDQSVQELRAIIEAQQQRAKDLNDRLEALSRGAAPDWSSLQDNSKGKRHSQAGPGKPVSFNLFDADLVDVIKMFMNILGENYMLNPGIKGRVTLHLEDSLRPDQLRELLAGLLRINNMAMVKDEHGIWEFMPLGAAPQAVGAGNFLLTPASPLSGAGRSKVGPGLMAQKGQVIQAFRLKYILSEEILKIIKPYLSNGAFVYGNDPLGILLVCDYPVNLSKVAKMIRLFDVSVFAGIKARVYALQYVLVDDLIKELGALAEKFKLPQKGPNAVSMLGFPRLNQLLVLAKNRSTLEFFDAWVQELDRQIPQVAKLEPQENIFVYYVQNGDASEIVNTLSGLFSTAHVVARKKTGKSKPLGLQVKEEKKQDQKQQPSAGPQAISGQLSGPVNFVVDTTTNAILIRCQGDDYKKIERVIEKLDIYPKQVLIEAMIAEVQLDETSKLGIEWSYLMSPKRDWSGTLSLDSGLGVVSGSGSSLIGSGLSYMVTKTDRFTAMLKAFADKNKVRILSSPHILASDNKEAKINVGSEVPMVTSEISTTEASSTATTVDKSIQYRNVGIILTVTPHINENGLVRMELTQEVSEVAEKTVEGIDSPEFNERVASTSLAIRDGETIVIGGLMKQTASKSNNGIPVLNKIPVLKNIFGYEGVEYHNTELMIFITPHVIKTGHQSRFVTQGFLRRLQEIKEAMQ